MFPLKINKSEITVKFKSLWSLILLLNHVKSLLKIPGVGLEMISRNRVLSQVKQSSLVADLPSCDSPARDRTV